MRVLCLIMIGLWLFLTIPSCNKSQEQPKTKAGKQVKKKDEKVVKKRLPIRVTADDGEATIKRIDRSDNTIEIKLTNNFPVRIVQFIIKGIEVAEVRSTTRTERFNVKYNKEDDKFSILSFSDDVIAPGTGSIAEIVCDKKSSASLSGINIFK